MNALAQANFYYGCNPETLTSEVVDIPISVRYSASEVYAGFLLSVDRAANSALVKIAIGTFPRPPIVGFAYKIKEENLCFEYRTVNLALVSFMRNLGVQEREDEYDGVDIPDNSFIDQYAYKSPESAEYSSFCWRRLAFLQHYQRIDLQADFQDQEIASMQQFKSRIVIKQIGYKVIAEEVSAAKAVGPVFLANRKLIGCIKHKTMQEQVEKFSEFDSVRTALKTKIEVIFCPAYVQQVKQWHYDYHGLFKGVIQAFLSGYNFASNLLVFVKSYSQQIMQKLASQKDEQQRTKYNYIAVLAGKTLENIDSIDQRFANYTNTNQIHYSFLLLMIFFYEALPLSALIQAVFYHLTLSELIEDRTQLVFSKIYNTIKAIILTVFEQVTQPLLYSLFVKQDYAFQSYQNYMTTAVHNLSLSKEDPVLKEYMLKIMASDIENAQQNYFLTNQSEYSILISLLSCVSFDYVYDFNYVNFYNNGAYRVFNLLCDDADKALSEHPLSFSNILDFFSYIIKHRSRDATQSQFKLTAAQTSAKAVADAMKSVFAKHFNVITLQYRAISLLKMDKPLSKLQYLVDNFSIQSSTKPIKSAKELSNFSYLNVACDSCVIKFEFFRQLVSEIYQTSDNLKNARGERYFLGLTEFDIEEWVQQAEYDIEELQAYLTNQVLKIINQLSSHIYQEIKYTRNVFYRCSTNPSYFKIALEIRYFFCKDKLLYKVFDYIYSVFSLNGEVVLAQFPRLMSDSKKYLKFIEVSYGNMLRSCTQWVSFVKQLREEIVNFDNVKDGILDIVNAVDGYVVAQTTALQNELLKMQEFDSVAGLDAFYSAITPLKLYSFRYAGKANVQTQRVVLSSFAKTTAIGVESEALSTVDLRNKLVRHSVNEISLLKQYYKHFDRSFDIGIQVDSIVTYVCYIQAVLFELASLGQNALKWRTWLLKDPQYAELADWMAIPYAVSPSSLILGFAPLIQLLYCRHYILEQLSLKQKIKKFPAEVLLQYYEKLLQVIRILHARTELAPFYLTSNHSSYLKQGMIVKKKEAVVAASNMLKLDYSHTINLASQVLVELYAQYYKVAFVYFVQDPLFEQKHFYSFAKLMQVPIDKQLDYDVYALFYIYERNNDIVDYILLLRQNVRIDYHAKSVLDGLQSMLDKIIVQNIFPVRLAEQIRMRQLKTKADQASNIDSSLLHMVLISPIYWDSACSEILECCSKIINNIGFFGEKTANCEQPYDQNFELMYFQIADYLQDSYYNKEQHKLMRQWRYSQNVESQARDIDAITQVLRLVLLQLKNLPIMLFDLLTIYNNNELIVYQEAAVQSRFNLISAYLEYKLLSFLQQWNAVVDNYILIEKKIPVVYLVYDEGFCQQITVLYTQVQAFYDQVVGSPFADAILLLHNEVRDGKIQALPIGDAYLRHSSIIPHAIVDGYYHIYAKSLLLDVPVAYKFSRFSISRLSLLRLDTIYPGFKEMIVSEDGSTFTGMKIGDYSVLFNYPVSAPSYTYQILDVCDNALQESVVGKAIACYDHISALLLNYSAEIQTVFPSGKVVHSEIARITVESILAYFDESIIKLALSTYFFAKVEYVIMLLKARQDLSCVRNMVLQLQGLSAVIPGKLLVVSKFLTQYKQLLLFLYNADSYFAWKAHSFGNLVVEIIDMNLRQIVLTDIDQNYRIRKGSIHYYIEESKFGLQIHEYLDQIMTGIYKQIPVLLVGFATSMQPASLLSAVESSLKGILYRRFIRIHVSENGFFEQLCLIERHLICGTIVLLFGYERLSNYNIQLLNSVIQRQRNKKGPCLFHYISEKQLHVTSIVSREQREFKVRALDYSEISAPGYLLLFIPGLKCVYNNGCLNYCSYERSEASHEGVPHQRIEQNNQTYIRGYMFQYQQYVQQIVNSFDQMQVVLLDGEDMVRLYVEYSTVYGVAFFEVAQSLKQLSDQLYKFECDDIPFVINNIVDINDVLAIACVLCDYILRQSYFGGKSFDDKAKCSRQIGYIIAAAFGLDYRYTVTLLAMCKQFGVYTENSEQSNESKNLVDGSKQNYFLYYYEYFKGFLSQNMLQNVDMYMKLHQLSLLCSYDLFFTWQLAYTFSPVLLLSSSHTYLKKFLIYYQVVSKEKGIYIYDAETLKQQFRSISFGAYTGTTYFLIPSYLAELYAMNSIFSYYVLYNQLKIRVLLCLATNLFADIYKSDSLPLFRHKLVLFPVLESSLGDKLLLLYYININKYYYSRLADFKLYHLWSHPCGSSLTFKNISNFFNLSKTVMNQCKMNIYYQIENRLMVLQSFVYGAYSFMYDVIMSYFGIRIDYEGNIVVRNLVLLFLYKQGILTIMKRGVDSHYFSAYYSSPKECTLQLMQEILKLDNSSMGNDQQQRFILRQLADAENQQIQRGNETADENSYYRCHLSQEMQPVCEIGGYNQEKLNYYQQQFDKLYYSNKNYEKSTQSVLSQYLTNYSQYYGQALNGSLKFSFDENFLLEYYVYPYLNSDAFANILACFLSALWSAVSLYYVAVFAYERLKTSDQLINEHLSQIYGQFLQYVTNPENTNITIATVLVPISAMLAFDNKEDHPQLNLELFKNLVTKNNFPMHKVQTGLNQGEYVYELVALFVKGAAMLPRSDLFRHSYISVETAGKKLSFFFYKYQIGEGILKSLTQLSERYIIDQSVGEVVLYADAAKKKVDCNVRGTSIPDSVISIYTLSETLIFTDQTRAAFIVFLGGCLLSSITVSLIGQPYMGKTVLLSIAKLFVRELIDSSYIHADQNENTSESSSKHILQAVLQKCIVRNYRTCCMNRYYSKQDQKIANLNVSSDNLKIIDYYQSMSYPCFHISFSGKQEYRPDDAMIMFLKDHVIYFSDYLFVDNTYQRLSGVGSLSDCSIIIESRQSSTYNGYSSLVLHAPPITEDFMFQLLEYHYKQHSYHYIRRFVSGFFMLKSAFTFYFLHNFQIVQTLFHLSRRYKLEAKKEQTPGRIASYKGTCSYIGALYYQNASNEDILAGDDDAYLEELSVLPLFNAFSQHLPQRDVMEIQERLSSLDILGYLDDEYIEGKVVPNPWGSSELLISLQFNIVPCWEAQIYNSTLNHVFLQNRYLPNDYKFESPLLINCAGSAIEGFYRLLSQELMVNCGYYDISKRYFQFAIEQYQEVIAAGLNPNPILYVQAIRIILDLLIAKQRNTNLMSSYLQYGIEITNKNTLSGILSECYNTNYRQAIYANATRYSSLVLYQKEFRAEQLAQDLVELYKADSELYEMYVQYLEEYQDGSSFGGLPLSSAFQLRIFYAEINLLNFSLTEYHNLVNFIAKMTGSLLFSQFNPVFRFPLNQCDNTNYNNSDASKASSQVSGNSNSSSSLSSALTKTSIEQKIQQRYFEDQEAREYPTYIYDLIAICNQLLVYRPNSKKIETGFSIVDYIFKVIQNYKKANIYNDQQLDAIQVILCLRIIICLSVGIRPDIIVDEEYNCTIPELTDGIRINSKLATVFPSKLVPNGRFMASLPIKCASWAYMTTKYRTKKRRSKHKKTEILDEMIMMPVRCILLLDSQHMSISLNDHTSIHYLLQRALQPTNLLATLFTTEEIAAISILVSYNFQVEGIIDCKMISYFIATNLQIVQFNNDPFIAGQYANSQVVAPPIMQFYPLPDGTLEQQQNGHYFEDKMSNAKLVKTILYKVARLDSRGLVYSVVNAKFNSFHNLYAVSQCFYPKKYSFHYLKFDNSMQQNCLLHSALALYKELSKYSKVSVVSFKVFTRICVSLFDMAMEKIYTLDLAFFKLTNIYNLYDMICQPAKQSYRRLQLQDISMAYFQGIINKMLAKIYQQSKQDGIELTKAQQLVQAAVAEAIMLRDTFKTALEELNEELQSYQAILHSLAIDVSSLAALLVFNINDQLDNATIDNMINSGNYGDINAHLLKINNNFGSHYHPFNYYVLVFLTYYGYDVRHIEETYQARAQVEKVLQNYFILANNSFVGGKYMLVNNIVQILNPDWPILPIVEHFKLYWKMSDPYYSYIQIALLNYLVGFSTIYIDNKLAVCFGLAIASQHNHIASLNVVSYMVSSVQLDSSYKPLIDYLLQKVQVIDLALPFGNTLQKIRTAINGGLVLVFVNFGHKTENRKSVMMLRKLLMMKCTATTKTLKSFSLGPISCDSAIELQNIPIIVGYSEEHDCADLLKRYNMYTQATVNHAVILKMISENYNEQRARQLCDSLVANVFGHTYCQRYYYEQIRVSNAQTIINIHYINQLVTSYFKQYIMHHLASNKMDFDSDTFHIRTMLRQEYSVDLCNQFSSLSNSNKKQQTMLDIVMKAIKNYSRQKSAVSVIQNTNCFIDEVNFDFELRCLARLYLKQYIIPDLDRICESIDVYLQTMRQMTVLHVPLISLQGRNLHQLIINTITWDIEALTKRISAKLQGEKRELTPEEQKKYGVKLFIDEYPLLYYAKRSNQEICETVLKSVFSSITKYLSIFVPNELLSAFWIYSFALIFSYNELLSDDVQDRLMGTAAITQLFTNNLNDVTKQITAQQLYLSFEGSNVFSIQKMFPATYIQTHLDKIDNISKVIPDLCKMSSKLQYSWVQLQSGSKYNLLLRNTMQYFLKNTAIFVNLAKAYSPLLTILRGYAQKYPYWIDQSFTRSEEHRWLFDKMFKGTYSGEIQYPPQGFNLNSLPSYYTSFLISSLLQPQIILYDIETFAALISERTGLSPSQLIVNNQASPMQKVHGNNYFGFSVVSDKVLTRFGDYIAYFFEYFMLPKLTSTAHLVDTPFYMLCSLAGDIVHNYRQNQNAIAVVYLDNYFDVQSTLQCVGEFISALMQIPFIITSQQVDDEVLQFSILETMQIREYIREFLSIRLYTASLRKNHPWILVCPSNIVSSDVFSDVYQYVTRERVASFTDALLELQENEQPACCYVQQPRTPLYAFQHIFNIAILMFSRYYGKGVRQHLFYYKAFVYYILYYSLQFQTIRSDRLFYNMFRQLADQCCNYSEMSFDLQKEIPEAAQFELSAIQMNFDQKLCQLIAKQYNLSTVVLPQLCVSYSKQRSIQLLSTQAAEQPNEELESDSDYSESGSGQPNMSTGGDSLNTSFDSSPVESSTLTSSQQTETSDNSSSIFDQASKRKKKTTYKVHNAYAAFLLQIRQFKNSELLIYNLDIEQFSRSVFNTISSTERNAILMPVYEQYAISSKIDDVSQIMLILSNISSIMATSNDNLVERAFSRRLFCQPIPELAVRKLLAKRELKAFGQNAQYGYKQPSIINYNQLMRALPTDLASYYKILARDEYIFFTGRAADFEIFNGFSAFSHCDVPVNEPSFVQLEHCWEFDGEAIIHVLGDILQYLRIIFAIKNAIPLQLVKIAGFFEKPEKQPFIDAENNFKSTNDPFIVCKVTRLRIFHGFYDTILRQLVNLSDIEASGFTEEAPVYFVALSCESACDEATKINQVPSGFVALQVQCGGLVKPLVYVQNRSGARPEEFNRAGMFIGVGIL